MTLLHRRPCGLLLAIHLAWAGAFALPLPAAAMQILDAADHAELAAEISATGVNRIALAGDRIAKVVRAPDGFAVEHDAASGDLYLRRSAPASPGDAGGDPVTLFVGTEKGFTYRLTLVPAARDSAQILIRNGGAGSGAAQPALESGGDARVAALVRLVRAVARREALPGYAIEAGRSPAAAGLTLIETWRGSRFAALVFEAACPASPGSRGACPGLRAGGVSDGADGAAGLAGTIEALSGIGRAGDGGRLAALWLAAPGTAPAGGRLAVAVVDGAVARGLR